LAFDGLYDKIREGKTKFKEIPVSTITDEEIDKEEE